MRAAIYARVSTFDQEPENQFQELRRYVEASRGLGHSGSGAFTVSRTLNWPSSLMR